MNANKTRPWMAALMAGFLGVAAAMWIGGQSANAAKAIAVVVVAKRQILGDAGSAGPSRCLPQLCPPTDTRT